MDEGGVRPRRADDEAMATPAPPLALEEAAASLGVDPGGPEPEEGGTPVSGGGLRALWSGGYARRTFMLWVLWFGMVFSYYGIFTWLPLGYRVLRKVEDVVVQEMDAMGWRRAHSERVSRWQETEGKGTPAGSQ